MFFIGERRAASLYLLILFLLSVLFSRELPGLCVDGSYLYDKNGEIILIHSIYMPGFFQYRNGSGQLPEMAKTGASCCLIFRMTGHLPEPVIAASALDKTIQNYIDNQMMPMMVSWSERSDCTGWCLSGKINDQICNELSSIHA